jgi:O-antigen ligase
LLLGGGWLLGALALTPLLTKPFVAVGLLVALVALALAWTSIAYPIGLAGIPTVIDAFAGFNPLPKGATTFLLAAWIGVAALALILRGEGIAGVRGLFSLPVAMALALLALMMLRFGASGDQSYGMQKIELYFADSVVLLIGAVLLGANRRAFRLSLLLMLGVAVAEAVYLIGEIISGGSATFVDRFAVSAQEGPILLGRDSATGALIAMFVVLAWPRGRVRTSAIVALPLCLISLVAAGSRGPVVAFVVGLITLLSLVGADRQVRQRLALLIGALVGAAILVPLVVPGSAIGRALSTILGSAGGLSSNGRSALWSGAYTTLGHHVLLGIGTGGFGSLNLGYPYPHNILLEIGLELGVLGLLAFVLMLGSIGVRLTRLWRETRLDERLEASLLIALLASAVVNALFSGALPDNRDIWRWGGIAIGMYAYREMTQRTGGARHSWA